MPCGPIRAAIRQTIQIILVTRFAYYVSWLSQEIGGRLTTCHYRKENFLVADIPNKVQESAKNLVLANTR